MTVSRYPSDRWNLTLISCVSTHSIRYCIIPGHHGRLPMDGTSGTRQTSLGRTSGELFAKLPSSMAHGSHTILGVYAHDEAFSAHAIPSTLSHSEPSPSMVVRFWFYHCLQYNVHRCITILLLTDISSMVCVLILLWMLETYRKQGTSLYQNTNASIDQHYTSRIPS
jgi:hypothetical protein